MKRIFTLVLVALSFAVSSCRSVNDVPFEPLLPGLGLSEPLDSVRFARAARMTALEGGWSVIAEAPNELTLESRRNNGVMAQVRLLWSSSGYEIRYKDSELLSYSPERGTIHRTYRRWVQNLNQRLARNYLRM